jgi:MFS family permease
MNLVCTIGALFIIDRIGRKKLLLIASGGMFLSLAVLGLLFQTNASAAIPILLLILCYVASFSIGMGPGVWVVLSELFPTKVRGRAMSLATIALWIACLLITLTFLSLVKAVTVAGAFWLYGILCAFTFFFVWRFTVETKGRTLEEIERSLRR